MLYDNIIYFHYTVQGPHQNKPTFFEIIFFLIPHKKIPVCQPGVKYRHYNLNFLFYSLMQTMHY